jgi:hypothetical protein
MINEIVEVFKKKFEEKGYRWYDGMKPYNLNIFSIRSKIRKAGKFDDYIFVVFRDNNLKWVVKQFACTTDPGTYYLKKPANVKGTAILVPGQYEGVYKVDKHKGQYDALCQRNGKVKVYRDDNMDQVLDYDVNTIDEGWFGINIHRANSQGETKDNRKWSAGCTVLARSGDFAEFMYLVKKSAKKYGNSFTYTLFNEE